MIRVLLWHQSNLVSQALATVLGQEDDFAVVPTSGEAHLLVDVAKRERFHVAILDHELGHAMPVADACHRINGARPDLRILVLMDRPACIRAGADLVKLVPGVGLMDTASSPDELVRCVRRLTDGQPVLDANLAVAALKANRNPLTDREREVLRLTLHGEPISEIAMELHLSTGTVRNYLSRITAKTGARTRIEAIRIAESAGWI